uniref:Uncharacterized protein n=1 Tax=Avena sativa TaxID=4498 RepID=A0ACD5ZUN8_AVESA
MERSKQEQPEGRFGEAAAAMEATAAVWSLLHRLAQGCAGYLGLARLSGDYSLRAPATTPQQVQVATVSSDYGLQEEEEDVTVVQAQSRSMAFKRNRKLDQGVRDGGSHY